MIETRLVQELATRTYEVLGCTGFARVDLILGDYGPQVLEVNAIPGLTDTSLFPMAAEAAGIDFTQLVARILATPRTRPASEAALPPGRRSGIASAPLPGRSPRA